MDGVAPARQVLKLSGPPDVAAAVPFVVGFQPVESLVIIALKGPRSRILHTLRVDLSDVEEVRSRDLLEQPVHPHTMAATLKRNGAESALVVVLTESAPVTGEALAGQGLALHLRDELAELGIPVPDAILVQDERWFSYLCQNPECCPPEGTLVAGPAQDRVLAEMVFAGAAPLRGREEIAARVAPEDGIRARAVEAAVDALLAGGHLPGFDPAAPLREAYQAIRAGEQPEPQTAALCLVALTDLLTRDACLQPYDGDDGEAALELWCALTRLAPEGLAAPPACLVAFVALCNGRGALANSAIDRALTDFPDYSFAHLLAHLSGHGAPPKLMRRIARQTLGDLGYAVLIGPAKESAAS